MTDRATGTGGPSNNFAPGSLLHAAVGFEKYLDSETNNEEPEKTNAAPDADQNNATGDSDAAADPADDNADASADATDGEDSEADGSDADDAPKTESRTFTVKVDDKEEQVTESELIAGYQRQASYTRSSQALAAERKILADAAQRVMAEREQYMAALPKLAELLKVDEPNWEELRAQNPAEYAVKVADHHRRQQQLAEVQREQQRVAALKAADDQRAAEQEIRLQGQALLQKLPQWRDEKVRNREATEIQALMQSVGYSPDECALYDHRALLLMRKALLWERSQKARSSIKDKANKAPVLKPGTNQNRDPKAGEAERKRFHESGSIKDAAKLFEHLL